MNFNSGYCRCRNDNWREYDIHFDLNGATGSMRVRAESIEEAIDTTKAMLKETVRITGAQEI